MVGIDTIHNCDCIEGMKGMQDKSVDLCVTDPPYEIGVTGGGIFDAKGAYKAYSGNNPRKVMKNIADIANGFDYAVLDEICRVLKRINVYIWCSQKQLPKYIDYFVNGKGCNWDLLTWHKTNPVPTCGNKYLSDTEYLLFFREKGVKLHGSFATKKKWFLQEANTDDNEMYGHPTVKPLNIMETLIYNSSEEGDLVLDPFIGSGTTAVAAHRLKRHFIGFEINKDYYDNACKRIKSEMCQMTMF